MSSINTSKVKRRIFMSPSLICILLLVFLAVSTSYASSSNVQTYPQQAGSSDDTIQDRFNSPLQAGQMTLEDVLSAHPAPQHPIPAPLAIAPLPPTTGGPQATSPSAAPSSTSLMLMQGMQSALQQSMSSTSGVRAPQIKANVEIPTVQAPPSQVTEQNEIRAASPNVTYQPEQAPKNLANSAPLDVLPTTKSGAPSFIAVQSGPLSPTDLIQQQTAPSLYGQHTQPLDLPPSSPQGDITTSYVSPSHECVPHVSSWVKTCPQAGYDTNYVGAVNGETRTLCPDNRIQDVWLSNNCVASSTGPASIIPAPTTIQNYPSTPNNLSPAVSSLSPASPLSHPIIVGPPIADKAPDHCIPHNSFWTKTCVEAGYPDNYTGKILGETNSVCPDNTLQDVWISNSCAPPEAGETAAPLTAPDTSAASKASGSNGECGTGAASPRRDQPTDNLCSVGEVTTITGNGPWTWTCRGLNGGTNASCETPAIIDGMCGNANHNASSEKPNNNLCYRGIASYVKDNSLWLWTCAGINGGISEDCSAEKIIPLNTPLTETAPSNRALVINGDQRPIRAPNQPQVIPVNRLCGPASELMAIQAPDKNLCTSGTASNVEGNGPWTWSCLEDTGHSEQCSTLSPLGALSDVVSIESSKAPFTSPTEAPIPLAHPRVPVTSSIPSFTSSQQKYSDEATPACGMAAGNNTVKAPAEDFCAIGEASTPVVDSHSWTWTCSTKRGGQVTCSSYIKTNTMCGAADTSTQKAAPTTELCILGTASKVKGSGPWSWMCVDESSKESAKCSAKKAQLHTKALDTPSTANSSTATSVTDPSTSLVDIKPFPTPPRPTTTPAVPNPNSIPSTPTAPPALPSDAAPVQPPYVAKTTLSTADTPNSITQSATETASSKVILPSELSMITFSRASENIDAENQVLVDKLAAFLQNNKNARLTLTAYADGTGITVREARRLSLVRALAVRDSLTSQGIPSSHINVRALGQAPSGNVDRIDVTAD